MSTVEGLLRSYQAFVQLPWDTTLSGPQRVWFALYEPNQERRLRARLQEFRTATLQAGYSWSCLDLTDAFAQWLSQHEYREAYFETPEFLDLALQDFAANLASLVDGALQAPEAGPDAVVAICGVASLFGLARVSALVEATAANIRGRMLVFFPGQRDGSNYRLLDARDGWNYLAIPIEATEE